MKPTVIAVQEQPVNNNGMRCLANGALIREGKHAITVEVANWLLSPECTYQYQRTIKRPFVEMYKRQFLAGYTRVSEIVLASIDGKLLLLDGRHRLTGLAESGEPQTLNVSIVYCETMDEVRREYALIASQYTRAKSNALSNLLGDTWPISTTTTAHLSAGLKWMHCEWPSSTKVTDVISQDIEKRAELLVEHRAECEAFAEILVGAENSTRDLLRRASVISVALATLRDCRGESEEFWQRVAQDDGLRRGEAEWNLLRHLRDTRATGTLVSYQAGYVASAWNAFMRKEENSCLKRTYPVYLLGTRYKK